MGIHPMFQVFSFINFTIVVIKLVLKNGKKIESTHHRIMGLAFIHVNHLNLGGHPFILCEDSYEQSHIVWCVCV